MRLTLPYKDLGDEREDALHLIACLVTSLRQQGLSKAHPGSGHLPFCD